VYDASTERFGCADDEGAEQAFDGYDNTGGVTLSTTATVLNIDTERKSDDAYTLAADVVTINQTGTYQIVARITVTPTDGNDKNTELIRLIGQNDVGAGFVNIDGAICEESIRNHANENGSCTITWIQDYTAGDDIRLQHQISGVGVTGTTVADGSGIIITMLENSGADLAEIYFTEDKYMGQGNIVSVEPNYNKGVVQTSKEYQNDILGVISTKPGIVIGNNTKAEGDKRAVILALAGRVPTKVSIENGAIEPGDPITSSSIEGVGMKAIKPGRVVGVALEGYSEADAEADAKIGYIRTIEVFINPSWYSGDPERFGEWFNFEELVVSDVEVGEVTGIRKVVYEVLKTFGAVLENGMLTLSEVFADRIVVKNAEIREAVLQKASVGDLSIQNSLQMVDQNTGKTFCMVLSDGALVPQEGNCDELEITNGSDAPVITINGNNPAEIELNTDYADLGALVSDDRDTNLGITTFVEGVEVGAVTLDTSEAREYTISYQATDNDGNTTIEDRVVIVGGGAGPEEVESPEFESVEGEIFEEVIEEETVEVNTTDEGNSKTNEEGNTIEEEVVDEPTEEVVEEITEPVVEDVVEPVEEVVEIAKEVSQAEPAVEETVIEEVVEEPVVEREITEENKEE
jgi:hypothetical protein